MAVVAGIDEAGYGPVLGPLVVSAAAFRVPQQAADSDLWEFLSGAIARKAARGDARPRVADSKLLHHADAGIEPLERNVLPFVAEICNQYSVVRNQFSSALALSAADGCLCGKVALPENVASFLRLLGVPQADGLAAYPWHRGEQPLPRAASPERVFAMAECLRKGLASAAAELCMLRMEMLEAGEFNREVAECDNKAEALGRRVAANMRALWDRFGAEGIRLAVDKQGGRNDYRAFLLNNFYGCSLTCHCQSAQCSRYTLRDGVRRMEVTFEPKADSRHLPVALASMLSKYARELMMEMLNEFWLHRVPGLRPTAGYLPDGWRFLAEIEAAREAENIQIELLKRCR